MSFLDNKLVRLYCPNCGHKITGTIGEDNSLRIQCNRCSVVIFSKPRGKKEINIKLISKKAV